MATDILSGGMESMLGNGMDSLSTIMVVIIWIGVFLVPVVVGWHILRHKHRVQIKRLTDNGAFIVNDKAREVVVDGVHYWKLLKGKALLSVPPPDVIQMTKKGRVFVSCYYSDELGYVWAKDTVTKDTFKEVVQTSVLQNGETVNTTRRVYQPFSTQERALLAGQIRKAAERRGTSLMDKIMQFLPLMMVFMMFVLVLIFWEDIAKPAVQMSASNAEVSKQNALISEQNARILVHFGYDNISITQPIDREMPPDAKG